MLATYSSHLTASASLLSDNTDNNRVQPRQLFILASALLLFKKQLQQLEQIGIRIPFFENKKYKKHNLSCHQA